MLATRRNLYGSVITLMMVLSQPPACSSTLRHAAGSTASDELALQASRNTWIEHWYFIVECVFCNASNLKKGWKVQHHMLAPKAAITPRNHLSTPTLGFSAELLLPSPYGCRWFTASLVSTESRDINLFQHSTARTQAL